jgi:hypothetical protein
MSAGNAWSFRVGPRCAFFVGNGLSMRLCKYLSLDFLDLANLVQPEVLYDFADADPALRGCSLWSRELFPNLCSVAPEAIARAPSFQQAVEHVLSLRTPASLNFTRAAGAMSFHGGIDPYDLELRAYLWLLFESISRRFVAELQRPGALKRFDDWPWRSFMLEVCSAFATTFVSFNYECLLETTLARRGIVAVTVAPNAVCRRHYPFHHLTCHVWKPHGCVSFYMPKNVYYGPRPWRTVAGQNIIVHNIRYSTPSAVSRVWPAKKMPVLPDIVPPGERHSVIADTMDYTEQVREVVSSADVLVFVGLSARPPDDQEIKYMLQDVRTEVPVLHAGIAHDDRNHLATLLKDASRKYSYFPLDDERGEQRFFEAALAASRDGL